MAPKKTSASSAGYTEQEAENNQTPTPEVPEENQTPTPMSPEEMVEEIVLTEQILSDLPASSADNLTWMMESLALKIEENQKMKKQLQTEISRRALEKEEAETRKQMVLDQKHTLQVSFMGEVFSVVVRGGATVGSVRRAIIRALNKRLMKKLSKEMSKKLSLLYGTKTLVPRSLVKGLKVNPDDVLMASFSQSIMDSLELLPVATNIPTENESENDEDSEQDVNDDDEQD